MTNKETIHRQDVLDLAKKGVLISNGSYKSVCKAINELPAVNPQEPKTDSWSIKDVVDTFKKHGLIREQEPCEDAISRKQAIYVASGYCHPANVAKELAKLPSVNPQPCEDAISRQAVLDIVDSYSESRSNVEDVTQDMISDILALPPVTPQPKIGHWIRQDNTKKPLYGWYFCSECNSVIGDKPKFCSNCGAKMEDKE